MTKPSPLQDVLPQIAERERTSPEAYPGESIAALYQAGVISAPFSARLGGADMDLAGAVAAIEDIACASPSCALIASMPLGLAGVLALGPEIAPDEHRGAWSEQIER